MADSPPRVRGTAEMIDATVQLIRVNYAPLLTIAAIGSVPMVLLGAMSAAIGKSVVGAKPVAGAALVGLLGLAVLIALPLVWGALIQATSDAYLGRPIDIAGAYRISVGQFFSLMFTYILGMVAIAFGMVLLIVPGIIIALLLFVSPAAVVLEGLSPVAALKRSWDLCQNNKGRIFACWIALLVIAAISFVISRIIASLAHAPAISQLINAVFNVFLYPFMPGFVVMQYYQARIEKEGYDVELLAQSVAPTPVAAMAVE